MKYWKIILRIIADVCGGVAGAVVVYAIMGENLLLLFWAIPFLILGFILLDKSSKEK